MAQRIDEMFQAIQESIMNSELSYAEIAERFNVTVEDVYDIEDALAQEELAEYQDSLDGDFDTAMASAGFGTDEDYGYYSEEF